MTRHVSWAQVVSFGAAAVVLLLIPGPSVLFVVSRGVGLGRRAALATIVVLLAVVNDALYAVAAGSVRSWLLRTPRRAEALGGASGLCMIGLGVSLAASGRTDA